MVKKGDTLIEVTIAIGIFSMIAIAVASVMSSGTSGSQMALETTLAREEIDAQAEALRFIQSSYISSKRFEDTKNDYDKSVNPYRKIWGDIIGQANGVTNDDTDVLTAIEQFSPSSCDELYNHEADAGPNSLFMQKAFILNLKQLSEKDGAVIKANDPAISNKFVTTTTYPRLIFGSSSDNNSDNQTLVDKQESDSNQGFRDIYQAAGIYIVAVKDQKSTIIANKEGQTSTSSAFYDFYIRSCWYGTDATRPSTISTVVRLYDPDVKSGE